MKYQTVIFAVVFLISLAYGYYRLSEKDADTGIRLSVVQGSIEQVRKWDPSYADYIMDRYETLTMEAAKDDSDLIVWPETAVPGFLDDDEIRTYLERITKKIRPHLFAGALTYEAGPGKEHFFNSAVLFSSGGEVYKKYDKIHLVPFGEYIPFEARIPFLRGSINAEIGDCTAGSEFTIFDVTSKNGDSYKYGALICFEDIFPGIARSFSKKGADFLVNITNDAWFRESGEQLQHAQASVFRAVENRVAVLRAANNGFSCFISPNGVIEDYIGKYGGSIYASGFKTFKLSAGKHGTFYAICGDIFICVCLLIVSACYFTIKKT